MVKKLLQDVLPPRNKTIRHIPLPDKKRGKETVSAPPAKQPPIKIPPLIRRKKKRRYMGTIYLLAAVAAGAALLTWVFSSATVFITPKSKTVAANVVIQSKSTAETDVLVHQVVTASSTVSVTAEATESKQVERRASGTIVIYNNFSTTPQRLIKNTRFEATDGRIYRIDASVVVPGQFVENGKKVPGSITAKIFAESAGAEYNMKIADLKGDFSIPGFKGTDRYGSFYGRLQTDITGGFKGVAKVVDEVLIQNTVTQLKSKVREELWSTLRAATPQTHILYPSNFFVEYIVNADDLSEGETALISVEAVGRGVIYGSIELSMAIAKRALPEFKDDRVLIRELDKLEIMPKPSNPARPWEDAVYVMEIKGNPKFVWQFDVADVTSKLAGSQKTDLSPIMSSYPAIEKAEVVVKPFWLKKFPKNAEKIKVEISLD